MKSSLQSLRPASFAAGAPGEAVNSRAVDSGSPGIILDDREFELFQAWMYKTAGIHLSHAKRALVAGRLNRRLRELNLGSFRQYYEKISGPENDPDTRAERQTILDLLTTNETYFFRESAHFDFVREVLVPGWAGRPVRCWSAASSSGEEAYTLAMVLARHHRGDWSITGSDINSQVVASARQGIYPMLRSKNIPRHYLHQYCRKGVGSKNDTFRVSTELRERVTFLQANLQQSLSRLGTFDLIFLRNVMIYFDQASKQRVLHNLVQQLKPGGILFTGHAESLHGIQTTLKLLSPSIYIKGERL